MIEIISPSDNSRDTKAKFDLYEENGVQEYWMVYPGLKMITAYILEKEKYKLADEYIEPGFILVATLPGLALE
ncbi:Uma2 family endonuclease [Hymenobacter sp. BRD67]|uniref:Uma2 family endonuclease n=1 Tax=Hymenobacter sp. BRD67 TaxID=2675877 RepID=UPI0015641E2E|nr:Uma2 family endonuclease [Hymenobacter sp. BRD67]QKG54792.1 Uma2 family endonuclease [Hymenobacter sp. BRD67]